MLSVCDTVQADNALPLCLMCMCHSEYFPVASCRETYFLLLVVLYGVFFCSSFFIVSVMTRCLSLDLVDFAFHASQYLSSRCQEEGLFLF